MEIINEDLIQRLYTNDKISAVFKEYEKTVIYNFFVFSYFFSKKIIIFHILLYQLNFILTYFNI
jgi:hypothetical protein